MKIYITKEGLEYARQTLPPTSEWYKVIHNDDNFCILDSGAFIIPEHYSHVKEQKSRNWLKVKTTIDTSKGQWICTKFLDEEELIKYVETVSKLGSVEDL